MITIKDVGDLSTILRHYKAIPILIRYIKEQPDHWKVLKEWDDARDFCATDRTRFELVFSGTRVTTAHMSTGHK